MTVLDQHNAGTTGALGRWLFATAVVVPPLLVLGAAVALALRTLTPRTDGTRGPREWLQAVLASAAMFAIYLVLWFGSFAPSDNPRVTIVTMVEHRMAGAACAEQGFVWEIDEDGIPMTDDPLVHTSCMADVAPLTGELQVQVMAAVWRLGRATVEQVLQAGNRGRQPEAGQVIGEIDVQRQRHRDPCNVADRSTGRYWS